ncbi:transglycosylase SLT domain-containing protein [Roseomonas sp. CAU 1739]|uniref:transglycosylase SLT domain-containing protein n=1 Tax=Roseomonas sp. CAU 1739 TaxID=3140364 RepID=UPI00325C1D40
MTGRLRDGSRAVLVAAVLSLLAACAQTSQRSAGNGPYYNRPDSTSPPGPPGDPWGPWIRDASRRFDVPETWIREVMRQESGGRATATSPVGAMGLMQVMPGTYRELQARYNLGNDPYHPYDSIQAGAAYLREMYELYGSPAFLAAYNAGPRRLEDYLWGGRGLPNETRNYVARIGPRIEGTHPNRRAPAEVYAAADIGTRIAPGPRPITGGTAFALREQRQAPAPVMVASAPPPPPAATTVQVASLAPMAPPPPAPTGGSPTYMTGAENPTLTASARAALAEAARQSEIERGQQQAEEPAPSRAPAIVASALAAPERRTPAASPFRGFGLVGSAQASTLPPPLPTPPARQGLVAPAPTPVSAPAGGGSNWSVQVGAFASENLARTTANHARDTVATMGTRTAVTPVRQGSSTLYRARVTGMTRAAAEQACSRLRGRGDCTVVAPGA